MSFVSLVELATARRQKVGRPVSEALITVSVICLRGNRHYLAVKFSEELLRRAKLKVGDRVDVMFDPKDRSALLRKDPQGYKISSRRHPSGTKNPGEIRLPVVEGMPYPPKRLAVRPVETPVITDNGVLFFFPDAGEERRSNLVKRQSTERILQAQQALLDNSGVTRRQYMHNVETALRQARS